MLLGYHGFDGRTSPGRYVTLLILFSHETGVSNNQNRILVVEDDSALASMVADFLIAEGFDTVIEGRGDVAAQRIVDEQPDAVVLDISLPGMSGFEVCKTVRSSYSGAILMLTARGDEVDEVVGLGVGADDYMAKPVRPRALLARLKYHLRKQPRHQAAAQPVNIGDLTIDPARRQAVLNGQALSLTTAEFELLWLFAENAGKVLSRSEIYPKLYGLRYDGVDRSLDLRVSRLRKKLGDDPANPERIKSVRGVGYLLSLE